MRILGIINYSIAVIFFICYFYQMLFFPIVWIKRKKTKEKKSVEKHKYAVLVCARNEEVVLPDLLESIKRQTYPSEYITTFVMADNCTDNTAGVARQHGAKTYERKNDTLIGKGYALEALIEHVKKDYGDCFDGYFVFDADNILSPSYFEEMNKSFSGGSCIVTSYRNSKNFGSNWISAGYALWFLRESRYLNHARYLLGTSCAVSGTGFLFGRDVLKNEGGWHFHMLTEDIEFSVSRVTKGYKIAFCEAAEFYDEQPVQFSESWNQRLRWSRGFLQVFKGYGAELIRGALKGSFSCFDMSMTTMPAYILSAVSIIGNLIFGIWGAIAGEDISIAVKSVFGLLLDMYVILFAAGLITTITEWKHINTKNYKKVLYTFTFPLFMLTYIPISFVALFRRTTWKPIKHSYSACRMSADEKKKML